MNIRFNDKGIPLLFDCASSFGNTTGSPEMTPQEKKTIVQTTNTKLDQDFVELDGSKVVCWGASNDFPQWADQVINKTGVLNSGLKYIRNFTIGQGLYACTVTGYNEKGEEIRVPYKDAEVTKFLNSRMVRRYMEKVCRDYIKFGCGFVQMIPNINGSKILSLNPLNALFVRVTERSKEGKEKAMISGKWEGTPASQEEYSVLDILPEYDPEMELAYRKQSGNPKSCVYMIRDSWSNQENYSEPVWLPAYSAGWISIAQDVPKYLARVFKNMVSLKWHIQIPYSFWEKKFPESDYTPENGGIEKRKTDIIAYMESVERNLTGIENADKPIFTNYSINEFGSGRVEESWIITALDSKSNEKEKLVTSAAANSEILFCIMVNPAVMGAGMPSGAYGNNSGGSNIREAFLVNIANAWLDRQNLLDPLIAMLRMNGYEDVEIRYRNTVLTTLDTNSGTQKVLS